MSGYKALRPSGTVCLQLWIFSWVLYTCDICSLQPQVFPYFTLCRLDVPEAEGVSSEAGQGVWGRVGGVRVAVGRREWVTAAVGSASGGLASRCELLHRYYRILNCIHTVCDMACAWVLATAWCLEAPSRSTLMRSRCRCRCGSRWSHPFLPVS